MGWGREQIAEGGGMKERWEIGTARVDSSFQKASLWSTREARETRAPRDGVRACETVTLGAAPGRVCVTTGVWGTRCMCLSLCVCMWPCKCTSVCLSAGVVYACVCERVGRIRWKQLEPVSELRRKSQWERSYQKTCEVPGGDWRSSSEGWGFCDFCPWRVELRQLLFTVFCYYPHNLTVYIIPRISVLMSPSCHPFPADTDLGNPSSISRQWKYLSVLKTMNHGLCFYL